MAEVRRILGDNEGWVEFKASGYPFSLRRKLRDSKGDEEALETILPFIVACEIPKLDGTSLSSVISKSDLEDVEEQLVASIIWQFYEFRAERMREPLTKNI